MDFSKTTAYSDMLVKQKIAPMLNLDPEGPWDIVSETETGLVMVHHRPDSDMDIYGALRGVSVDTNKGNIVCYSYPNATKIVTSSLSVTNGRLLLDENISLDPEKLKIKAGFEGPLIHVFKHAGKVYHSTRKRFDSSKSRWGNSKTFGEMYKQLSGPEDDVLFDSEKAYSPYCHTFIMVHPEMLVCTKDNVGDGYMVYLGPKQMYSTEICPYPIEEVDTILRVPDTSSEVTFGKVYSPQILSLEEANKHLLFGFYDGFEGYQYLDPRLLPGEFVILEDTETGLMYRIESPSYYWRSSVRNNNPNILHRFYELLDYSYLKNTDYDNKKYIDSFPILTSFSYESLKKIIDENTMVVWPQDTEKEMSVPNTKDDKFYNIWLALLISMPLCRQKEIIGYHDYFNDRKKEVIEWLNTLSDNKNLDISTFSKRVQDILLKTKTFAVNRFKKRDNKDKNKSVEEMTKENIKNFIGKEMGNSLYRMLKEMDRYNNPIEK